jgi:hypothetical protein
VVSVDESLPLRPCFEALVVPPRRIEIVGGWKRSGDFNEPPQCFWNATVDGADKKTPIEDEGFSRHSPMVGDMSDTNSRSRAIFETREIVRKFANRGPARDRLVR